MKEPEVFELERVHLILLSHLYIDIDAGEGDVIDGKRPYGNSAVHRDVADILEVDGAGEDGDLTDKQADEMWDLHNQTVLALKIVLQAGTMEPGKYVRVEGRWRKAGP